MNKLTKYVYAPLVLLSLSVSSAFAAVPATVTTALSDAATDTLVVGGAILAIVVGITAITYMKRASK